MGDKVEGVYCRGDLVFAKVRGYPPWPARVSNILEMHDEAENSSGSPCSSDFQVEGLACKSSKEVKYSVLFFGTFDRAACTESNLFHYKHHKEKYGSSRRRGFEESLQQIEEAAREVPLNHADIVVKEEVMDTVEASDTDIKKESVSPLSENTLCDESVEKEAMDVDFQVTASGAYFVVKEEAIDAEETPLSEIKRETSSNPSNLIKCEDPVKDENVDVNLVCGQQSTAHMTELPEHHCSTPENRKINSAYLLSRISIQNKSEEAHRENGELLKGCSRESPQEGCSDTAASFSCSVEPLRVQDVEGNDQNEKCSRKCSGVGESHFRRPKKSMACNRDTQSSSSNKASSKQIGRQKQTRKPFCCDTCCKCFPNMVHLENHKRKHTGEKPFCCALCNKACATKSNLAYHMKVHSEERPYKCSSCDKSFKESGNLKRHMRLHSGEKPFCCALCHKTFFTKRNFAYHLKVHSEERPYKCSSCDKSFKENGSLKRHMQLHSGEKPFCCALCHKTFFNKRNLACHLKVHSEERPYKCSACNKSFKRGHDLVEHKRLHSGEKPYECSVCNKAFTQSTPLITHMRTHTGKKPYKCTECGKAFTHRSTLTCHMWLHSGEKPFGCTECGKAFARKYTLYTHMRTHTGERLFYCKSCESSFTQSSSLTRHRRIVHGVASPVS